MSRLSDWLAAHGLGAYAALLERNDVDLDVVADLGEEELAALGMPLGARKRLLRAASTLATEPDGSESPGGSAPEPERAGGSRRSPAAGSPLDDERKLVTILFADIVGSTELVHELDPEDAGRALDPALRAMMDAVARYEGTVNRVQGDGLMAMFGAPTAHEDHALRGCRAALDMRAAVERLAGAHSLRLRIGLHSGEVLVRVLENDLSLNYDAVGVTAHLAARVEALADAGSVRITAAVERLAAGLVDVEPLGPHAIRGIDGPVDLYRLDGIATGRSRLDVAGPAGMTPVAGRDAELALLESRLAAVERGEGQVVFIAADAGMGKSRLLFELRRRAAPVEWLEGRAVSFGRAMSLHPVIDLLNRRMGIEHGDPPEDVVEKISEGLAALAPGVPGALPYLRHLLSVDPGDPAVRDLDSRLRRRATFEAIRDVLVDVSTRVPVALVIEDLHWVDSETAELLDFLIDDVAGARILVLLTHRPGYDLPLGDHARHTRLALPRISRDGVSAMTSVLLGGADCPPEVRDAVADRAEGNPFFVEELVKSLVETDAIHLGDDGWLLRRSLTTVEVPGTIQDVLAARIDRLDDASKRVLQVAAVIGREFTRQLVDELAASGSEVGAALNSLESAELIYTQRSSASRVYLFKNALTQEVAYRSTLATRRRDLHARIGRAIMVVHANRLGEHHAILAWHFERAECWEEALEHLGLAVERAVAAFAVGEALELNERAIGVATRLGGDAAHARRVAAMKGRAGLQFAVGNYAGARAEWERVLEACRESGDRFGEASALAGAAWATQWDEDFERAMLLARAAITCAEETGNEPARAGGLVVSAYIPAITARLDEARPIIEEAMHVSHAAGDVVQEVIARFCYGTLRGWQGEFDPAIEIIEQALDIARTNKVLPLLIRCLWANGVARVGRGDYDIAMALLREGFAAADKIDDEAMAPRLLNTLGWLHLECADLARGLDLNVKAEDRVHRRRHAVSVEMTAYSLINQGDALFALGDVGAAGEVYESVHAIVSNPKTHPWMKWRYSTHLFASLARFRLSRGDPRSARDFVDRNMEIAQATKSRKYLAIGRRILAEIALAKLDLEAAEREARAGLALARRVGNPPELRAALVTLARVLDAGGSRDAARDTWRDADAALRATQSAIADRELAAKLAGSESAAEIAAALAR